MDQPSYNYTQPSFGGVISTPPQAQPGSNFHHSESILQGSSNKKPGPNQGPQTIFNMHDTSAYQTSQHEVTQSFHSKHTDPHITKISKAQVQTYFSNLSYEKDCNQNFLPKSVLYSNKENSSMNQKLKNQNQKLNDYLGPINPAENSYTRFKPQSVESLESHSIKSQKNFRSQPEEIIPSHQRTDYRKSGRETNTRYPESDRSKPGIWSRIVGKGDRTHCWRKQSDGQEKNIWKKFKGLIHCGNGRTGDKKLEDTLKRQTVGFFLLNV